MTTATQTLARQLLDAQLQFWLQELSPARLSHWLREDISYIYRQLDGITLQEAVDADKIKITAHRYALEMEYGGGIPELFGEIANIIYEHPAHEVTTVGAAFGNRVIREFIEKAFEPDGAVEQVIRTVQRSAPFQVFIADVVMLVLKGYLLEENNAVRKLPLLGTAIQRIRDLVDERLPMMQEGITVATRRIVGTSINNTLAALDDLLDKDSYRDETLIATLNLWDDICQKSISEFRTVTSEEDLQEWMVLGYEFWRSFRQTDYLKTIIDTAVDFVFAKYGEDSLQKIIADFGISEAMVEGEILHYADDLASILIEKGIAETLLRRQLERFYLNEDTLALLNSALPASA